MNELLERFFELDTRQRIIAAAAAVFLVFGAYWYLVYSGRHAETVKVIAKIGELRQQRDDKQKIVATLCSATTFRFLDEKEREEIAKEKATKAKEDKKKK